MEQRATLDSPKAEAEINKPEWLRLPDPAFLLILKQLDFADIKSCRLVCKQWHRDALHNIRFILVADRLGPNASRSIIISRLANLIKWRRSSVFRLVPYPSTATRDNINNRINATWSERRMRIDKPPQKVNLDQLNATFISVLQKINHVVCRCSRDQALPILLRTLVSTFPAAERIVCATKWPYSRIWAEFEIHARASSATWNPERPMCVVNSITTKDVKRGVHSMALQLALEDAASIQVLTADDCRCIETTLAKYAKINGQRPLIFSCCKELKIQHGFKKDRRHAGTPIDLSRHCPALRHLECSNEDLSSSIYNLMQLDDLESLVVFADSGYWWQPLPELRLENLTKLQLERYVFLPEDPSQFAAANLEALTLGSYPENMERLADHAQNGGGNLCNLEKLQLNGRMETNAIEQYLRPILTAASKLQTLIIPVENILSIATVSDIAAVASTSLAAIDLGYLQIPGLWNCGAFLRNLVVRIKQSNLKAVVAVAFADDAVGGLASALSEADICGNDVAVSKLREEAPWRQSYELSWFNKGAGIQQKLQIQVL